jgi:1,4-alpha-glucan branching enzyme
MKNDHNHDNIHRDEPQRVPVCFEFTHPTARSVSVAGTFNQWQPEAKMLHPVGGGHWLKETVLVPGTYEYLFVVDGQWTADPHAKETIQNPFGGVNSVLNVTNSPEAAHLTEAENLPMKSQTIK